MLESVHPAFGRLGGGTPVMVAGRNFGPEGTAVRMWLGDTECAKVDRRSDAELSCLTAPGAHEGEADATVRAPPPGIC